MSNFQFNRRKDHSQSPLLPRRSNTLSRTNDATTPACSKSFLYFRIIVALIIANIGWAGYTILLQKFAKNRHVHPVVFSLLRDCCTGILLIIIAGIKEGIHFIKKKDIPVFLLLGATGMYGNQVLFIYGEYYTNPTTASTYQPCNSIVTALLCVILGLEKMPLNRLWGWAKLLGILCAAAGAVVMANISKIANHSSSGIQYALGNLFLLGNASCYAVFVVAQKKFLFSAPKVTLTPESPAEPVIPYPPIHVTAWCFCFGAVCLSVHAGILAAIEPGAFEVSENILAPLVYAVLVSSALCYGLVTWANSRSSSILVTTFSPVQVLSTVILSFIVFGDVPVLSQYLGSSLIICGLFMVCWSRYQEEKLKDETTLDIQ